MTHHIDPYEYERNKARAQTLLILAESYMSPRTVSFVQEYIDHDEHGLALESILDELIERAQPVPRALVDDLRSRPDQFYPGGATLQHRLERLATLASDEAGEGGLDGSA